MTQRDWLDLRERIVTACEAWAEILKPTMKAISKAVRIFHDACWAAYREAGTPYGENDEGMWRWARECARAARLRREAEEIELYHRQMVAFRKMLAERRGDAEDSG